MSELRVFFEGFSVGVVFIVTGLAIGAGLGYTLAISANPERKKRNGGYV